MHVLCCLSEFLMSQVGCNKCPISCYCSFSDNVDVLQHGADIVLVRVSNLGPRAIAVVVCVVLCFLVL